jgi:hypothetical protein
MGCFGRFSIKPAYGTKNFGCCHSTFCPVLRFFYFKFPDYNAFWGTPFSEAPNPVIPGRNDKNRQDFYHFWPGIRLPPKGTAPCHSGQK